MPSIPQNISYTASIPVRIPSYLWIGLILVMSFLFTIEPLWSTICIFTLIFISLFVITSIINPRTALTMLILVALLVPVRFMMRTFAEFAMMEPCSLLILAFVFIISSVGAHRGKISVNRTPLDTWLIALLLMVIVNVIFSQDTTASINMWQHFLIGGPLIYMLIYNYFNTVIRIRKLFTTILIIIAFTGIYLIIESLMKLNPIYHHFYANFNKFYSINPIYYRTAGFAGHAIITGTVISVITPFAIFGLQYSLKPSRRILFGVMTCILLIGALTTNTRGTFITLIIIVFLMFVRSQKSLFITILIISTSIIFFTQFGFMNALWTRLSPQYLSADPSLWHRILMYWTCSKIFLDYPIFGAGLNSIWELYPFYRHPLDILDYGVVDNIFLSFLYGTGVVGIIVMIGLLAKIIIHLLRYNWSIQPLIVKRFRITGCIGILGGLINSLTVDAFDWIYFNLTFWTIIALMIRLSTLPRFEIAKFFRIYGYDETAPELQPIIKPPKT